VLYALDLFLFFLLVIYCWFEIKKIYERGEILPHHVSASVWALYILHIILVLWTSVKGFWPIPINITVALVTGVIFILTGLTMMIVGILEFRSFKRMSGLDASKLITTGIYRYSRNPQNIGWFLALVGISIMGRSLLALLLTAVFITGFYIYTVKLEEPYLERIFGEEYRWYKESTSRYFGLFKGRNSNTDRL